MRYYVDQARQVVNRRLHRGQRRFLTGLRSAGPRVTTHMGRLEPRMVVRSGSALKKTLLALDKVDMGLPVADVSGQRRTRGTAAPVRDELQAYISGAANHRPPYVTLRCRKTPAT